MGLVSLLTAFFVYYAVLWDLIFNRGNIFICSFSRNDRTVKDPCDANSLNCPSVEGDSGSITPVTPTLTTTALDYYEDYDEPSTTKPTRTTSTSTTLRVTQEEPPASPTYPGTGKRRSTTTPSSNTFSFLYTSTAATKSTEESVIITDRFPSSPDLPTISYLPPEETASRCALRLMQIGIPQRDRSLPNIPATSIAGLQSNFGAFMLDAARPGDETVWETKGPFGHKVYEHENYGHFMRMSRPIREYNLLQRNSYFGSGHVVYAGEFIYNRANTPTIVAFSFATGEIRVSREFNDAYYEPLQPVLFPSDQPKPAEFVGVTDDRWLRGFIKLAADENGLWAMYLHKDNSSILVVHQIDPFSLDTIFMRQIYIPKVYGTAFIICGGLYTIADEDMSSRNRAAKLMQLHDIFTMEDISKMIDNVTISIPRAPLSMLTYLPHRQPHMLYAWGQELQFKYKLGLGIPRTIIEAIVDQHDLT